MALEASEIIILNSNDVVICDRTTLFGNKFRIGRDGTREEVIAKYREWIWGPSQKILRETIKRWLKDKKYWICHCAPEPCHLEVIRSVVFGDFTV